MKRVIIVSLIFIFCISLGMSITLDSRLNNLPDNQSVRVSLEIKKDKISLFQQQENEKRNEIAEDLAKKYNVEYIGNSVNEISLIVNGSELDELAQRKDIQNIRRAMEFKLQLQDSVSLINATLTGDIQINGFNLTGAGQTICIIDSGINYTHEAFGSCSKEQYLAGNCSKVVGGFAFYNPINSSNKNDIMGDSNHGTHVAGIVAGNGTMRGVVPDAKIVAIKACGPTSTCDGNAVVDGINWCVGNSTMYNISVISMSLGTSSPDLFSSYCDDQGGAFTSSINAAVAKNISVIAASGNEGNRTHISLPACISNVTSVGATDKSDNLAYNRAGIMSILAPGVNINSTILSGSYSTLSGTSMATPHIAGVFAIMKQFLATTNLTRNSQQLTIALNSSGKNITDTTGFNYTRINLYETIIKIGNNITLISPVNSYDEINTSVNITFNFSIYSYTNTTFDSCSLYSNSVPIANVSILNQSEYQNISYTFEVGNYSWKVLCDNNLSEISSETRTFDIYSNDSIAPEVTILSPEETTYTSNTVSINVMTNEESVCVYNFVGDTANNSLTANSSNTGFTGTSSSLSNGEYTFRAYCNDSSGNLNNTETVNFTISVSSGSSGSSGGGGGGGGGGRASATANIVLTNEQIIYGYSKLLSKGDKINFKLNENEAHSLNIDFIEENSVNLTIRSDPIKLKLFVGEERKINLTNGEYYDLFIKVESIQNNKANLTIKEINEPLKQRVIREPSDWNITLMEENDNETEEKKRTNVFLWIFLAIVFFIVYFALKKPNKHRKNKFMRLKH